MNRIFACLLFLATGCCPVGVVRTEAVLTGKAGQAHVGRVEILLEGQPAPPILEEVAIVQAQVQGTYVSLERLLDSLRNQAASLGCNALVRVKIAQGESMASAIGIAVRTRPMGTP
jgi:hypothetical protein